MGWLGVGPPCEKRRECKKWIDGTFWPQTKSDCEKGSLSLSHPVRTYFLRRKADSGNLEELFVLRYCVLYSTYREAKYHNSQENCKFWPFPFNYLAQLWVSRWVSFIYFLLFRTAIY